MKIYLVRHGRQTGTRRGGCRDRRILTWMLKVCAGGGSGREIKGSSFEIAFCSPLIRARHTAETIVGERQNYADHRRKTPGTQFRTMEGPMSVKSGGGQQSVYGSGELSPARGSGKFCPVVCQKRRVREAGVAAVGGNL